MRSAAAGCAWELGRRPRWGWVALGAWLAALLAARLVALATGKGVFAELDAGFAFAAMFPGTVTLFWFIVIFSRGHGGNLGGRQSILPARLFVLPVTNTALAAWPMAYAAAAVALLWVAIRVLAPWPAGVPTVPYLWPGLLAMVFVAWVQAIVWTPFPLPGLRVAVAVLWLALVDAVCILALEFRASEPFMLAMLAPQPPLAYLVARHA